VRWKNISKQASEGGLYCKVCGEGGKRKLPKKENCNCLKVQKPIVQHGTNIIQGEIGTEALRRERKRLTVSSERLNSAWKIKKKGLNQKEDKEIFQD